METDTRTDAVTTRRDRTRPWSRREALAGTIGLAILPWISPVREGLGMAPAPSPEDGELPPRTVGLRSLGGAFRFDPPGLRIAPGDTVTWLNMGDFHTVTAFHPANDDHFPGDIPRRVPEGTEPFHSGMLGLDAGSRFEHRFPLPGVYDYFCQPHYGFGMVGRVAVGGRADAHAADASELNEAARRELPTLEDMFGSRGVGFEWAARINGVLLLRADRADDIGPPTLALREALLRTAPELLDEDRMETFRAALDRLSRLAVDGDYEELLRLADDLKAPLY